MSLIPNRKLMVERAIEDRDIETFPREHLGMSEIGHSCARFLWYQFRWCFKVHSTPRMIRLFEIGHMTEPRVIDDLKRVGCHIEDTQREIEGFAGHFLGHCDGVVYDIPDAKKTPHLLEIKTSADKYFTKIKKDGIKLATPKYWAQSQLYMGYLGLTRALFVVENKDTSERYYERVYFSQVTFEELNDKAVDIISSEEPPPKIGGPDWYECKWCPAFSICHEGESKVPTCRSCRNVSIVGGGKWNCKIAESNKSKEIGKYKQMRGCESYVALELLDK